jgi:hypothetical protein
MSAKRRPLPSLLLLDTQTVQIPVEGKSLHLPRALDPARRKVRGVQAADPTQLVEEDDAAAVIIAFTKPQPHSFLHSFITTENKKGLFSMKEQQRMMCVFNIKITQQMSCFRMTRR